MSKPLAIDLFCGLGGWTEGLLAEGYECVGYDIEAHEYGDERYPGRLVVQDALTLHGSQFKDAALIVASPPCQRYSYMAMPWSKAKAKAAAIRADTTGAMLKDLNALFDACFRIQREACAAAGRHIPLVVENVKGAQPWVGRAKWNFGSYYLWGDVPALMPKALRAQKFNPDGTAHGQGSWFAVADSKDRGSKNTGGSWFNVAHNTTSGVSNNPDGRKNPGFRFDGSGRSFQSESVDRHVEGLKAPGGAHRRGGPPHTARLTNPAEGRKGAGAGAGAEWFDQNLCSLPSKSPRRKAASAKIAKIPFALSQWIARTYKPDREQAA